MDVAAAGRWLVGLTSRVVEAALAFGGLAYTLIGGDSDESEALFLLLWVTVAVFYLLIGGVILRRQRLPGARPLPPRFGRRFSFFLTAAASLTGLGAATAVLTDRGGSELTGLVTGLGVAATICAWILLHTGYARFYSTWADDLRYPKTPDPTIVDHLYFAVTVGVSFAASDVEVRATALRWHVMVHSVVSFFYNAVVLAIAVGVITGR
jgi:uncharacterized membrane protein